MQSAFPDAVVTGYEELIGQMTNDGGDRHVVAAAYENPPMTTEQFLERLARAGVPHFAARVLAEL